MIPVVVFVARVPPHLPGLLVRESQTAVSGAARQFISLSEFRRSTEACVERGYLNEWYGETIVALCDVVVAARSIVWRKDDDGSIRVVEGLDKLEETLKRFM